MDPFVTHPEGAASAGAASAAFGIPALLGAAVAGAALSYFLDRERGARRRSLMTDRLAHARSAAGAAVGTTGPDVGDRARGTDAAARSRLEPRERPDDAPVLPESAARPPHDVEVRPDQWSRTTRLLAGAAGGALAVSGAKRRNGVGALLGLLGMALVARGTANRPLGQLAGSTGRRGVNVDKTVTVNAPVADIFGFFTEWESWPQWMSHVRSVTARGPRGAVGERTHWVVDGPAGTTVEWDAETTELRPNELVAWTSVEGSAVEHAGRLTFAPNSDGSTRVQVRMSYNPPAGVVGHAVATLLGRGPKRQMNDDLARLKTAIETGMPPRDAAAGDR